MDGISGDDMDTGVYGYEFRLPLLFNSIEIRIGNQSAAAQLLINGVGFRKVVWMVFWYFLIVFSDMDCPFHGGFPWFVWLRSSMASHSETRLISAFLLCLSSGCSITWFNTICFVLCIKNFPENWPLAVSLSVSFNGVTAALYNLIVTKISSDAKNGSYLILNAFLPLITSVAALIPILQQPCSRKNLHVENAADKEDAYTFGFLYLLAAESLSSISNQKSFGCRVFDKMIEKDRVTVIGEEHTVRMLVTRCDFWLYFVAYFCGGTIGLVYSNNLGQISQSRGYVSETRSLVTIYSTCSFFGRLISAGPDLVGGFYPSKTYTKRYTTTRTGWLALSLVPMPIAFLMLVLSGTESALSTATGLIGISSGFVFSAAVSITSELFGSKSSGINHNILITNIPLGSLLYGALGAVIYDNQIKSSAEVVVVGGSKVCMGRNCYNETFGWWGCVSLFGLAASFLLTNHKRVLIMWIPCQAFDVSTNGPLKP
ncbi:Major facilitator superfamily domain, general substrate transporter, partial [Cynara cardunculus var. scolymus]